jgi:hypothetical protein
MGDKSSEVHAARLGDELHVLILWHKGKRYKSQLVNDLKNYFDIIHQYEVRWEVDVFSQNLSKFYGQKLTSSGSKINHIGTGEFDLFIVRDRSPDYTIRKTSRGHAIVNSRIFDFKERFRLTMGGGHLLHASNDHLEARHDFCLLFGRPISTFDVDIAPQFQPLTHLPGVGGWKSVAEIFTVLNECDDYVVMRNFHNLPKHLDLSSHGDIDLMSRNWRRTCDLLSGELKFNHANRRHINVLLSDGSRVPFDLRDVSDNYYDPKWSNSVLDTRVLTEEGVYVPNPYDLEFMTIYHALIHKHYISLDYAIGSAHRTWSERMVSLHRFMDEKRYSYTIPDDQSVGFDQRFTPDNIFTVRRCLNELEIECIEPFKVELWKNRFNTQYFSGIFKGKKVFIKYGGLRGSARREYEILKKLHDNGVKLFQNPILYIDREGKNVLVLPHLAGVTLDEYLKTSEISKDKSNFIINYLDSALESLIRNRIIHRDIRPENILIDEQRDCTLIDFQMAISEEHPVFKEYNEFKKNPKQIKNLGGDYKYARFIWNDRYSVERIKQNLNPRDCSGHSVSPQSALSRNTWYGLRNNLWDKAYYSFYNFVRRRL